MKVQALKPTTLFDKDNELHEVQAGDIIETNPLLYRQYMAWEHVGDTVKCLSHKYDEYGTMPVFISVATDDITIDYQGSFKQFKKGEQVFLNEFFTVQYIQLGMLEPSFYEDLVVDPSELENSDSTDGESADETADTTTDDQSEEDAESDTDEAISEPATEESETATDEKSTESVDETPAPGVVEAPAKKAPVKKPVAKKKK